MLRTDPGPVRAGDDTALVDGQPLSLAGEVPAAYAARNVLGLPAAERSERVRLALERFCSSRRVKRVEFPSRGGLGFRAIQAQRAGLAFGGVELAVRPNGTAAQERTRQGRLISSVAELEEEYLEWGRLPHPPGPPLQQEELGGKPPRHPHNEELGGKPPRHPYNTGEGGAVVTVCVPHYNLGRFLPETLASIAAQDYQALDVVVIDDGSAEDASRRVFDEMTRRYPHFRFLRQPNSGIGATRNRGLAEGRGEFFLPVDADNVLRPDMVSTMVRAMRLRPDAAALTCYFLAFENSEDITAGRFLYACRPTGGPFALACHLNVYGDACALYRAEDFRSVGGFEEDRGTSFEDWEAFVKLAGRGLVVDVVPEHLFYYRHLSTGFSRVTDPLANRRRVLRRFRDADGMPAAERELVYEALAGMAQAAEQARRREGRWPYRLARQAWRMVQWLAGGGA